jgi:type I restriction enzyme S subunit
MRHRGVIPYADKGNVGNKKSEDITRYKIVRPDDIVVNCMNVIIGSVGLSRYTGCLSPVYYVLTRRSGADNPRYLNAVFQTDPFQKSLVRIGNGILAHRMRIPMELLKCEPFPKPPREEQDAIVRFLDHANRRIERYIRAKRKLIALLNEQKQAIIHRAVTHGLDPNVRFKSSGMPWLGEVPEHWKALQLRRMVSLVTSGSRGWAKYYSDTGNIFLQSGNLGRSMSLNLSFIQHVKPPLGSEGVRTRVERDDVLVCVTGALTGNVALVNLDLSVPAYVNQHVALVRPKSAMVFSRYLAFALHSEVGRAQFKTSEYGGTKQGLGLNDVKSVILPFPPPPEQYSICSELDRKLANFNESITRTDREIALMREYRTRLVAAVATGHLDVREAAAKLPEETREEEVGLLEESTGDEDEPIEFEDIAGSGTIE